MITYISPTEQAQTAALTDAHYEIRAFGLRMDNDGDTIARLRGQLGVCADLMGTAAATLVTIEPESAAESEAMDALLSQLKAATLAIWSDGVVDGDADAAGLLQ